MIASSRKPPAPALILAALLLAGMFQLAFSSIREKSPTFDEGFYIVRGWAYLRTGHLLPLGHPPLTNLISGLGVLLEPGLPDPATLNGWNQGDAERVSQDLLWHRGLNAARIVWLARLPTIFLGLMLAALIWRWARELYGQRAATLALALMAFSPTILANSQLATTDLGVAAFYIAAVYAWARYLHRKTARWLLIAGVLFGLAQASKFSALLLIPTLGLMGLWAAFRHGSILPRNVPALARRGEGRLGWLVSALISLLVVGLLGVIVVWACQLFSLQPLAPGGYLAEFQHFRELATQGHRAYLLGAFSQTGWWYYHPLTLSVKLTLPELAALAAAVLLAALQRVHRREWEILFPALVHLASSMVVTLNVGIRYLLPAIPLLFVFASRIGAGGWLKGRRRAAATAALVGAQLWVALQAYPHYLAFFNLAAGGRDNGYRLLADSNLDWGQDLPGLAAYLKEHGAGKIYLSYFGHADPAYYGIDAMALPGWPPPTPKPAYYPLNPAPGLYAISASNLVGVPPWPFPADSFSYFRSHQPLARIGASIFVYEVPAEMKPPAWVAQCAAPAPVEQTETIAKLVGVADLKQFYFDCRQSLPIAEKPGWVIFPPAIDPILDLGAPDYTAHSNDGALRYRAWYLAAAPQSPPSTVISPPLPLPIPVADHLELLGYQVDAPEVAVGKTLMLTVWWRVRQPPQPPVSIFAHLLPAGGGDFQTPAAVGDTLGVRAEDWQPGMILIQRHLFSIGESVAPGEYDLAVGLYSLSTGQRFPVSQTADQVIDRIVLVKIKVIPAAR